MDIDLPIGLVILLPLLTMPGWALCSFLLGGALAYRWARGRKRRMFWTFGVATVTSVALPNLGLLLASAGAPAVIVALTALGVLLVVFYLKARPGTEE